jgi:hypothetical protein
VTGQVPALGRSRADIWASELTGKMLNIVRCTQLLLTTRAFKQRSISHFKKISEWTKQDVKQRVSDLGLPNESAESLKEFDGRTLRVLTLDLLETKLNFKFEHALAVTALIEAEKEQEKRAWKKKEEQEKRASKKKEQQEERVSKKKEEHEERASKKEEEEKSKDTN